MSKYSGYTPYGNYVQFNVPVTQQVYFHHSNQNDRIYGYDTVPSLSTYDTTAQTALATAIKTEVGDANTERTTQISALLTAKTSQI